MSLKTLLEAAHFLEMQEQHRATVEAALATTKPLATSPPLLQTTPPQTTITISQSKPITSSAGQTVVISSSNLIPSSPITIGTPVMKKENTPQPRHRILHNSFDIMNPLIIDDASGETKRKQPPMVFRAGTREVHNKLEKDRRAHLKECFDILKKQLPSTQDEKKTSNLSILHSALRYIHTLKRKERDLEQEMERLAREKIASQQRLVVLKKEISTQYDNVDFSKILPEFIPTNLNHCNNHVDYHHNEVKVDTIITTSGQINGVGNSDKIAIPILAKAPVPVVTQTVAPIKEMVQQQPVQTTALSVLPMSYPVNQGLVLQKVALLPTKGLTDLAPLVFAPQQLNGKVVPLTQYLVKPVVVVSTASPRPS